MMNRKVVADYFLSRINSLLSKLGYEFVVNNLNNKSKYCVQDLLCINVGSGDWEANGWINLDYPTTWYSNAQSKHKIVAYDIRKDNLPFEDNTVDRIYCSHVVEHVEDVYVNNFFVEAFRVLKKNGGIRISCPDAEFLYRATKTNQHYWLWRDSWFNEKKFYEGPSPSPLDYLIREVATPKLKGYKYSIGASNFKEEFESLSMTAFLQQLTKNLSFRKDYPGDHINFWTFDKMKNSLANAGFSTIIQSKWNASIFEEMQCPEKFDLTYPNMSLYVECVK